MSPGGPCFPTVSRALVLYENGVRKVSRDIDEKTFDRLEEEFRSKRKWSAREREFAMVLVKKTHLAPWFADRVDESPHVLSREDFYRVLRSTS